MPLKINSNFQGHSVFLLKVKHSSSSETNTYNFSGVFLVHLIHISQHYTLTLMS